MNGKALSLLLSIVLIGGADLAEGKPRRAKGKMSRKEKEAAKAERQAEEKEKQQAAERKAPKQTERARGERDEEGREIRRGERVEFDGRLIEGQTAAQGAIYLFERLPSELRSMVAERRSYRHEILSTLYPGGQPPGAPQGEAHEGDKAGGR